MHILNDIFRLSFETIQKVGSYEVRSKNNLLNRDIDIT